MTRKHFEAIAQALGESLSHTMERNQRLFDFVHTFAEKLSRTNPRFDAQRFYDAVLNAYDACR